MSPEPYVFEFDWFTDHSYRFAEQLAEHAGRPDLRYVEIGCLEGRCTVWLLDNLLTHPSSRLHCIDPWAYPRQDFERRFDRNVALAQSRQPGRVVKHRGYSADVLPALEAGSMDVVYVDGSHTAWDTLTDLVLSWRLLRLGGVMICDDYALETGIAFSAAGEVSFPPVPPVERPKMAIDAFMRCFEGRYRVRHAEWQVWLERTA